MNRFILTIATGIAALALATFATAQAEKVAQEKKLQAMSDRQFRLLCKGVMNGYHSNAVIVIDYDKSTANGVKAAITDSFIRWQTTEYEAFSQQNVVLDHELNRLAGTYRNDVRQFGRSGGPLYSCEKAPVAKF